MNIDYGGGNDYSQTSKSRPVASLTVMMNKNAATTAKIKYGKSTSVTKMPHLKKKINEAFSFGINYNEVRIFNDEGLELYDEDFEFLKDGDELYASRGDDFDHATYYSQYDIKQTLGFGGFGKVVLGVHCKTGEKVAIKSTKADAIDSVDDIVTTFTENETLKSQSHEGIVKIINFFMEKKSLQAFFIMEYLEGGELLDYVSTKGSLSEVEAHGIFVQIISAMDYCHTQKIIHRDLKLENILKVSHHCNRIKVNHFCYKKNQIVDFGIAGQSAGRKSEITKAGSQNYMAPEVFKYSNVGASAALDIWAIGCILYAMLCGNLPFNGKNDNALKKSICEDSVTYPEHIKLSSLVKDLIGKMLCKNPEKRILMFEIKEHKWSKTESVS